MISKRHGVLLCMLLMWGATACAGGSSGPGGTDAGGAGNAGGALAPASGQALHSVPGLADVIRLNSEHEDGGEDDGDDFLIQQQGAGLDPQIDGHHCTVSGSAADFAPQWSASGPNPAGSAAYAVYKLTYDPQTSPVTLSLAWNGTPPADSDCWVGLSDWSGQVWHWVQPVAGAVAVANAQRYVDAAQHCYVALLLLGQTPCSLATIGFGTPPPPPPPANGDGYTLFSPLNDTGSYLIDMDGNVVNQWTSAYTAGAASQLLENGHLLRAANLNNPNFPEGGRGGRLEEFDWNSNLVWSYELNTSTQSTHHDFTRLPNGNILMLVSNALTPAQIIAEGRNPAKLNGGRFWVDSLVEIQPQQPFGATIVWQWRLMDHLVQDFSDTKAHYGDPAEHPELLDLNFPPNDYPGDWTHCNAVSYNAQLDQIMITSLLINEIWVIDHSTTQAEAAGHTGGRYGHGGDFLYRWGNPRAYGAGTPDEQEFFNCHDGQWIADGLDGAGQILVYKNQTEHSDYSQIVQLTPPVNPDGSYNLTGGPTAGAYGPAAPNWVYQAEPRTSFFSPLMGSCQRLPGGETLIDSAVDGRFFVVDTAGTTKWEYQSPYPVGQIPAVFRATRYLPDYPGLASLAPTP